MALPEYGSPIAGLLKKPTLERFLADQEELFRLRGSHWPQALQIVDNAITLFQDYYAHREGKLSLYGADPIRRLQLLRWRLERLRDRQEKEQEVEERLERLDGDQEEDGEERFDSIDFHREMTDIFVSLRDRHVTYYWPEPFASYFAYLGFEVEEAWELEGSQMDKSLCWRPRYIVSRVHPDLRDVPTLRWDEGKGSWKRVEPNENEEEPPFRRGVEILRWNGMHMSRAVQLIADRNPGSNSEARRAVGLARMTTVPLDRAPLPEELRVTIDYTSGPAQSRKGPSVKGYYRSPVGYYKGTDRSETERIELDWRVIRRPRRETVRRPSGRGHVELGIDPEGDRSQQLRQFLKGAGGDGPSELFYTSEIGEGPFRFAYLRLLSFNSTEPAEVVREIRRRLHSLPQSGLVIDVRDNPGGSIMLAELLLQQLTHRKLEPALFQFVASERTRALTRLGKGRKVPARIRSWQRWGGGFRNRLSTGERYSRPLAISPSFSIAEPRIFSGPLVLIVNARSYSAADIFAAGFQDHRMGTIVGTHGRTGAGGANVMTHSELLRISREINAEADSGPLDLGLRELPELPQRRVPKVDSQGKKIPLKVEMSVAIRRALRVGANAGTPLEDLGVTPDRRYRLKDEDILEGNKSLKSLVAQLLLEDGVPLLQAEWADPPADSAVDGEEEGRAGEEWQIRVLFRGITSFEFRLLNGPLEATAPLEGSQVVQSTLPAEGDAAAAMITIANLPALRAHSGVLVHGLDDAGQVVAGWVLNRPRLPHARAEPAGITPLTLGSSGPEEVTPLTLAPGGAGLEATSDSLCESPTPRTLGDLAPDEITPVR